MGKMEDKARKRISEIYGSVPKMAEAIGMPVNTIYHALERGLDNTRTETSNRIKESLFGETMTISDETLADDERRILELYKSMTDEYRDVLMKSAIAFASASENK